MQSLATHIAQAHPQQHEYLQQKALEFMGLQTVMQYATTDANIQHSRNWLRWQIHQATIDARIPDDKIETQSRDFARELVASIVDEVSAYFMAAQRPALFNSTHAVEATAAKVERLVRGVRDVLQEPTEPKPPKP